MLGVLHILLTFCPVFHLVPGPPPSTTEEGINRSGGRVALRAITGETEIAPIRFRGVLQPHPWADYLSWVKEQNDDRIIIISKRPEGLSASAMYGITTPILNTNRSWIWDAKGSGTDRFYLDLNADGAFGDDEQWDFADVDGKQVVTIETTLVAKDGERNVPIRYVTRFQAKTIKNPKTSKKQPLLLHEERLWRRGTLDLPGRAVKFCILGDGGIFENKYDSIYFDLNRDGAFDLDNMQSNERYSLADNEVVIDGEAYRFQVDRFGRYIELTQLEARATVRAELAVGAPGPAFEVKDLSGRTIHLRDYRGKVVLLDFWGTWCTPCVAQTPELKRTYKEFHDRGFEILGLCLAERRDRILAFVEKHGVLWPQSILTGFDDELAKLYRVSMAPTQYLIDAKGKIVGINVSNEELARQLTTLLPEPK